MYRPGSIVALRRTLRTRAGALFDEGEALTVIGTDPDTGRLQLTDMAGLCYGRWRPRPGSRLIANVPPNAVILFSEAP